MTVLRILIAVLFVFAMCRAAGQLLLRAVRLSLRKDERLFLEFVTGAAVISTAVFFLAAVHLVYTSVLAAFGILVIGAALFFRSPRPASDEPESTPLPFAWRILFWIPWLIFGGLYLIAAMSPEISPDGTVYHVGLVSRYYEHRGFYPMTTNMFAGLGAGIEMLFLVAFAIGRHSATSMVHLLFLLTLPFGMLAYARRMNIARAGVIGAMLFYLAPVVGKDGTIAYIDVATAAVVFGSFCFLEIWRTEGQERALIPAGILAGFAFACKITAATAIVYAVLYVLYISVSRKDPLSRTARRVLSTLFFAILIAGPWMVKDALQFGNPFYPLFNRWFPNPYMYPMVEAELRRFMAHVSDVSLFGIPYEATIGGKLFGVLGPVFLLAPLAVLALRPSFAQKQKPGRILLLAFIPLFLPFFANIGTRFLIPSLPFLALALGLGILSIPRYGSPLGLGVILLHAGLSWPGFMNSWSPGYQWRIDQTDWRVALRVVPEKKYLEDNWPDYKRGLLVDQFVPPNELVFSPDMGQLAYQRRDLIGSFDSALGRRAFLSYLMPLVEQLGSTWNREIHFPAVTASRVRLVANTKMDTDLRIGEMRFALDKTEIPRQTSWKLTASANPWELPLAFDNSPVSFWTAGQYVDKGMWLQADFSRPVELDRVLISQSEDQRWISLHPEAFVDGQWKPLHARESDLREPPRRTLRREVRDELKAMNIRWILISDSSFGADDLRKNFRSWGISQAGEANGFRLWKLN